jgi:hypothetical protein
MVWESRLAGRDLGEGWMLVFTGADLFTAVAVAAIWNKFNFRSIQTTEKCWAESKKSGKL